jgi:bacterioferritin (cytochrome b1)
MIPFKNDLDRQDMLYALQHNMNEEFRATLQYICHRISAKDKHQLLAESFKSAALDEMSHILFFSDLITKYGDQPRFNEWEIDKSDDLTEMLQKDIELEKQAKTRYTSQRDRFKEYPEFCNIISSVLSDEDDHEEEFTKYLADT